MDGFTEIAKVQAAELRRQVAEAQAEIAALRIEAADLRRQLQAQQLRALDYLVESQLAEARAETAYLRRQLAEAETALLAVPLDSIRRWMVHSDAIVAVAAGDYDAGEAMLDVYLIKDWLSGLAATTDTADAIPPHRAGKGDIR